MKKLLQAEAMAKPEKSIEKNEKKTMGKIAHWDENPHRIFRVKILGYPSHQCDRVLAPTVLHI